MIFGSLFWQLGTKRETSRDLGIAMAALVGSCIFLCFTKCGAVQPVVSIERTVFYREKAAGMYSALPYALSQVLVEISYVFMQVLVYATTMYAMIGFEWTAAKYFGSSSFFSSAFFYAIFNLFSGFLIPKPVIHLHIPPHTCNCTEVQNLIFI